MKATYIFRTPYRDGKHKFVYGREYDLDQQTLDRFRDRFEIAELPKPKAKKAKIEEVADGSAELE